MRKTVILLLLLALLFSLPVQAAPTRELKPAALEQEDLLGQVQALADIVASVAFRRGLDAYLPDSQPQPELIQGLLYQAFASHLLVEEANEGILHLSQEQAAQNLGSLLAYNGLLTITASVQPGLSVQEDGSLRLDITQKEDFIGAHVYDLSLTEEALQLHCDVYSLSGIVASAVEAPDETLTWLGHISITLKPNAEAAQGFVLAGFEVEEHYQPTGSLSFVQKDRFEVMYPDCLTQVQAVEGAFFSRMSEDGSVAMQVTEQAIFLPSLVDIWQGEDAQLEVTDAYAVYKAPGVFRLAYSDSLAEQDRCLVLELRFPVERTREFELYWTFIFNSFVVYSHSFG